MAHRIHIMLEDIQIAQDFSDHVATHGLIAVVATPGDPWNSNERPNAIIVDVPSLRANITPLRAAVDEEVVVAVVHDSDELFVFDSRALSLDIQTPVKWLVSSVVRSMQERNSFDMARPRHDSPAI